MSLCWKLKKTAQVFYQLSFPLKDLIMPGGKGKHDDKHGKSPRGHKSKYRGPGSPVDSENSTGPVRQLDLTKNIWRINHLYKEILGEWRTCIP